MNFKEHYNIETVNELIVEADEKEGLDKKFIIKLMNYVESLFPSYGEFDNSINNELRKVIEVGDGKNVKKVKKKIHEILQKVKHKLLDTMRDKVEKVKVIKKIEVETQEPETEEHGDTDPQAEHRHDIDIHPDQEASHSDSTY